MNAPEAGTIKEFLANEEDTVTVGQDLVRLETGGAPSEGAKEQAGSEPKEAASKEQPTSSDPEPKKEDSKPKQDATPAPPKQEKQPEKQPEKKPESRQSGSESSGSGSTLGSREERRVL